MLYWLNISHVATDKLYVAYSCFLLRLRSIKGTSSVMTCFQTRRGIKERNTLFQQLTNYIRPYCNMCSWLNANENLKCHATESRRNMFNRSCSFFPLLKGSRNVQRARPPGWRIGNVPSTVGSSKKQIFLLATSHLIQIFTATNNWTPEPFFHTPPCLSIKGKARQKKSRPCTETGTTPWTRVGELRYRRSRQKITPTVVLTWCYNIYKPDMWKFHGTS